MTEITITLNKIQAHRPCASGWSAILARTDLHGGDYDREWPLAAFLDTDRPEDAIWAMRCLPEYDHLWRRYAVWCARQVQHLMTDPRSVASIDVAERHAQGLASDAELAAAREAASAAAWDKRAAREAAWAAVWAACGDASATVWAAAREAASAAAWDKRAARAAQYDKLRQILTAGEWVE